MSDVRNTTLGSFPILGGGVVPYALVEEHAHRAMLNHGQTVKMLARRGGLSWCEMLAVLNNQPWREMPAEEARRQVMQRARAWIAT